MLTADGADYAQLKRVAETMRQKLLKVESVTKVNLYGVQDEKIFVEFSHAKLATLGISPQAIFDSLAKQNAVVPAGTVETGAQRVPLRVTGAVDGVKAVADTPVEFGGSSFRLGDIATVTRGFEDPPSYLVHQRGKPALGIGIVMAKGANIIKLGEDVEAAVKQIESTLPQGIDLEKIADQPHVVDHAINEFAKSFAEALGIVLLVSFMSLGWRTGIVVALSVPLVLAITFIVMSIIRLDLHRISLGALIIALGLLVDDAIIAVEMMMVKMEQGWDRQRAASFAWTSTAFPMLTGTLVTAAGFLPVGFANSAVGEYAGGIFWVVAIALIASWFVAVVFTPYLGVKLLPDFTKVAAAHHDPHEIYETRFYNALRRVIDWCVRHRVIVVLATIGVFAAAVVGFGRVQQQFFPLSERPELFFQMRLPEGTSIGVTTETARKAEAMVEGDKDVTTYTTYIGQGSPRFWLGLNPQLPNEAFAEIVIVSQGRGSARAHQGAAGKGIGGRRLAGGARARRPLQFRAAGRLPGAVSRRRPRCDGGAPHRLRSARDHARKQERRRPASRLERAHAFDPARYRPGPRPRARPDAAGRRPDAADPDLGLRRHRCPRRHREGPRWWRAPFPPSGSSSAGSTTSPSCRGTAMPCPCPRSRASCRIRKNRSCGGATATCRSPSAPTSSTACSRPTSPTRSGRSCKGLRDKLEPGYRLEIGGAIEELEKGNSSIFAVFPLMLIAMLTILMIQLQSFSRLILVLLTAPLGLIGASLALNLSNKPFGFVALLGLIALAGMIMRNAVILVDQIESGCARRGPQAA